MFSIQNEYRNTNRVALALSAFDLIVLNVKSAKNANNELIK